MLYRVVNQLIEEKGYSHQRLGYVFTKAVAELDPRRYISRLQDPKIMSEREDRPAAYFERAERKIRAKFVRSLAWRIFADYGGQNEVPSIDVGSLRTRLNTRFSTASSRDSVESVLYTHFQTAPGNGTGYLTKVGKNVVDYLCAYENRLIEQAQKNKETGKRRIARRKKEGGKTIRKARKRPNPMVNHDDVYNILKKIFDA